MWYFIPARYFVGRLGHWLQYNVPVEPLFLWRARLGFVVCYHNCRQYFFRFDWAEEFQKQEFHSLIKDKRKDFSNMTAAMQKN